MFNDVPLYRNTDALFKQFMKVGDALLAKPVPTEIDSKAFCTFCLVSIFICCRGKCSTNRCVETIIEYLKRWIQKVIGGAMFGETAKFKKLPKECQVCVYVLSSIVWLIFPYTCIIGMEFHSQ